MSSGRRNQLTGQIAEHLGCAELGRRDLIATPFSGNAPAFDVIAADSRCRTAPIQVKATRGDSWPTDARLWMHLEFDAATGAQVYHGPMSIDNPELIYVCVALHVADPRGLDRFFVLTKADVQSACIESYVEWMAPRGWKRPRNPSSFDCRFAADQLARFEDNWTLIRDRLAGQSSDD